MTRKELIFIELTGGGSEHPIVGNSSTEGAVEIFT